MLEGSVRRAVPLSCRMKPDVLASYTACPTQMYMCTCARIQPCILGSIASMTDEPAFPVVPVLELEQNSQPCPIPLDGGNRETWRHCPICFVQRPARTYEHGSERAHTQGGRRAHNEEQKVLQKSRNPLRALFGLEHPTLYIYIFKNISGQAPLGR